MATQAHITGAMPISTLHEIHDCLTLALDATESTVGYTQSEKEAREYITAAMSHVTELAGVAS